MNRVRIRYCISGNYLPRATRVAALIKQESGMDADLEPGGRGELSVWVDGKKVADKTMRGFPADADLLKNVKDALAAS